MPRPAFLKPRLVPEPDRRGYQGVRERALMVEVWQYVKTLEQQDALSQAAAVLAIVAEAERRAYPHGEFMHALHEVTGEAVRWAEEVQDAAHNP